MRIDQHKLIQLANLERKAMDGFLNEFLPDTENCQHTRYFPTNNATSGYDCIVDRWIHGQFSKRFIFEIKIRNKYYPTLLLEKHKLDKFLKFEKDPIVGIYYINFTPTCTVVFDLLKLHSEGKITFKQEAHNIQTANKDLGKVIKDVAFLDVTHGKSFNFVFPPNG